MIERIIKPEIFTLLLVNNHGASAQFDVVVLRNQINNQG
jgi:hypothetical protein